MALVYAIVCDEIEKWKISDAIKSLSDVRFYFDYRLFLDDVKKEKPDLILLDLKINLINGEQLLIYIKHHSYFTNIPVLLIGDNNYEENFESYLDMGADDILNRKFNGFELRFHVAMILKKLICVRYRFGNLFFDISENAVYINEERIILTYKEFHLLKYLCSRYNHVVTRKELETRIWGNCLHNSRTLDMHIYALRSKVISKSDYELLTVVNVGYRLK